MENEKIKEKVIQSINRIRPYLQSDGGDIQFVELTDDLTVIVNLTGACHGCPFRMQTLKAGVENAVRQDVPEITSVILAS
ncbi:MAG: NifU family protein [Bacteroidales bacterium]|nr:NifU family protein [Bacteroidales bacterium]MBP5474604.1 NifU family protein [Bacteroidales bacterium]